MYILNHNVRSVKNYLIFSGFFILSSNSIYSSTSFAFLLYRSSSHLKMPKFLFYKYHTYVVKRISCHTSEIAFEVHFLKLDTKILRSKRDTGEKLGKFYSIMLLQAVDIMGKERHQENFTLKQYFRGILLTRTVLLM